MITKVTFEHPGWSEERQDYSAETIAVHLAFIKGKRQVGFVSFSMLDRDFPELTHGLTNSFYTDTLEFDDRRGSFEKALADMEKYIRRHNRKWGMKYDKILVRNEGWPGEYDMERAKGFRKITLDGEELYIHDLSRIF